MPILSRQIVSGLASLLISILLFRIFGQYDYGLWVLWIFALSLPNLLSQPIFTGLLRFLTDQPPTKQQQYFGYVFQLSFILYLVGWSILGSVLYIWPSFIFQDSIDEVELSAIKLSLNLIMIKLFMEFFSFGLSSYCLAVKRVVESQAVLLVKRLIELATISLIYFDLFPIFDKFVIVALFLLIVELTSVVFWLGWFAKRSEFKKLSVIKISFLQKSEVKSFFFPLVGSSLIATIGKRAGVLLLGYFQMFESLALFSVAERIFHLANKVPANFLNTTIPFFSQLRTKKNVKSLISLSLTFLYGLSSILIFSSASIWLKLWGIVLDEELQNVIFFFALNLCLSGFLQASSQHLLQEGVWYQMLTTSLFRRLTFLISLTFYHDTILQIVVAETVGIVSSVALILYLRFADWDAKFRAFTSTLFSCTVLYLIYLVQL